MPQKYVVRGVRGPGGQPYWDMADSLKDIAFDEVEAASEEGLEEARRYVRSAGTGRSWDPSGFPDLKQGGARRYAPSAGRINTGEMLNALRAEVRTGNTAQGRVGWLDDYEDYFGYQDRGFTAGGYRRVRQDVAGMGLMAHMRTWFKVRAAQAADNITRRAISGL